MISRLELPLLVLVLAFWIAAPVAAQSRRPQIFSEGSLAAIVGEEVITYADLDRKVELYIAAKTQGRPISPQIIEQARPRLRREILRNLIKQSLLLQEARREGITITEPQIDAQINRMIAELRKDEGQNIRDAEEYYRLILENEGLTREEFRQEVRKDMIATRLLWVKAFRPREYVGPGELRQFYQSHKDEFRTSEELVFRLILLEPSEDLEAIGRLIDEALDAGTPFRELAAQFSAVSKEDGGLFSRKPDDLKGWAPPLPEVILSMREGEIRRRIRTSTGLYYVKMESVEKGEIQPFDQVQGEIKRRITRERRIQDEARYVDRLREKYPVEIFLEDVEDPTDVNAELSRGDGATNPAAENPTAPGGERAPPEIRDLSDEANKPAPPAEKDSGEGKRTEGSGEPPPRNGATESGGAGSPEGAKEDTGSTSS